MQKRCLQVQVTDLNGINKKYKNYGGIIMNELGIGLLNILAAVLVYGGVVIGFPVLVEKIKRK